jgi:hypothetical protein
MLRDHGLTIAGKGLGLRRGQAATKCKMGPALADQPSLLAWRREMLIGGIRRGVGSASALTRMMARVPGSYGSGDGALAVVAFGAVPLVQRREDCRLVEVRAPTVLARRSGGQVQLGLRQLRVIDGRGRIRQQRAPSRSHTNGKLRSRSPNDAAASADRGETVGRPIRSARALPPRCCRDGRHGWSASRRSRQFGPVVEAIANSCRDGANQRRAPCNCGRRLKPP